MLIKRYAQSRLYDPTGARYVSLAQLREWVAKGIEIIVVDADTGAIVTATVLS